MNIFNASFLKKIIATLIAATFAITFAGCGLSGVKPESAVYISQREINIYVDETVNLTAVSNDGESVIWVSGSEDVATVDGNGVVKGVGVGSSVITAASFSAMASCVVNVKAKETPVPPSQTEPDEFTLFLDPLEMNIGDKVTLNAVTESQETINWTSSNIQVAYVKDGVVTALSAGQATVTASIGAYSASRIINVLGEDGKPVTPDESYKKGYTLVWRDEFNGNSLDENKWGYQLGIQDSYGTDRGPEYWGNSELQAYTKEAVTVKDGSLCITAKREKSGDRSFTSGRILTRDKYSRTYGYFEAKMKTPTGVGMWPAFWMLPQPTGSNSTANEYGTWPYNGEIDIMEARGRLENVVDHTIHFNTAGYYRYETGKTYLNSNTDEWHIYAIDWTADYIAWFVDGQEQFRVTSSVWSANASDPLSKPFDKPFYILFNFAIGGNYDSGNAPDASFTSASMYVDYVRVYEKNN